MNENTSVLHQPLSRPVRLTILVVLLALTALIGYVAGRGESETSNTVTTSTTSSLCAAGTKCNDLIKNPQVGPNAGTPTPTQSVPEAKKDETADWKIYTNTKYGYSLKYPDRYEVKGTEGDAHVLPLTENLNGIYVLPPNSTVRDGKFEDVKPNSNIVFSLLFIGDEFTEDAVKLRFRPGDQIKLTTTMVNGSTAYKVIDPISEQGTNEFYFVKTSNGHVLEITIKGDDADSMSLLNHFVISQ